MNAHDREESQGTPVSAGWEADVLHRRQPRRNPRSCRRMGALEVVMPMKLLRFALEVEDWMRSEEAETAVYVFGICCLLAILAATFVFA